MDALEAPRLAKKARLVWDSHERKYLLLYPERGLLLNEAAHAVVALCDGRHERARIVDILAWRFAHLDKALILRGVTSFLERLAALGLLEDAKRPRG